MDYEQLRTSAPGSFMLFGEHAVLQGAKAIVCAMEQRIYVHYSKRQDNTITISSEEFGKYVGKLTAFAVAPPFQFILGAIHLFRHQLQQGFDLIIESDCQSDLGFGTSAAVTVATVAILMKVIGTPMTEANLFINAREVVRTIQGKASGADVLASVYGGMNAYQATPIWRAALDGSPLFHLIYSGYKTPTPKVIDHVEHYFRDCYEIKEALFASLSAITIKAMDAIQRQEWKTVGKLMRIHQGVQQALNVNTPEIAEIIEDLQTLPDIDGEKISGSGMGDCVVCLGQLGENFFPTNIQQREKGIRQFSVKLAQAGIMFHD